MIEGMAAMAALLNEAGAQNAELVKRNAELIKEAYLRADEVEHKLRRELSAANIKIQANKIEIAALRKTIEDMSYGKKTGEIG